MVTKSPSLKDLIRLSFTEPVAWISGEAEAARSIQWVTTSVEDAAAGDVVLLPGAKLDAEIIRLACEARLAALLLVGKATPLVGADCGDLVIAAVPDSAGDIRQIQRLMLTVLVHQRSALMERGVRIHTQLAQLEAEGKGLEGLAKAISEISGRGVIIQDKRGFILAECASSTFVAIWKDVLEQLGNLEGLPEFFIDRKRAGSQASVVVQQVPGGLERAILPIVVGEMARGYLSLIGLAGELDELDLLVTEQGGSVCAIEMARNKAIREAEKRIQGDLLTALLQDNLSPRDASLWVQSMGLDLSQAHVALRFAWDSPEPPSRRRLETLINGEVVHRGLRVIVNPMGAEVICFCQVPPATHRPELAMALGQAVLDQGKLEYPNIMARCGIGTPALALEGWLTSLRHAGQALEMARRLGERKPLYYSDLSVYRLLLQLEHSPELIAFQEETIGPLLAYEGASELIHTLQGYFDHNGNLSQTAEALFIHRNTLIYRMERIASITSLDLDKSEDRLALQLALCIYRMVGRK